MSKLYRALLMTFDVALLAALVVAAMHCTSCVRPPTDYAKVPRQQISRVVHDGDGRSCRAYLPLVVRSELLDQDELVALLRASAPWTKALRFPTVVPAQLEHDDPTLFVDVDACPDKYRVDWGMGCKRLAEIDRSYCDGGVYRQHLAIYVSATPRQLEYILMHELGHAVGADEGLGCPPSNLRAARPWGHSCDDRSIMFHEILLPEDDLMGGDSGPDADFPRKVRLLGYVTAEDTESVRRAWGLLSGIASR